MQNTSKSADEFLRALPEWQQSKLSVFRDLVHEVAPEVTEDIKWGVPVFIIDGKVQFAMSGFKDHVKYNFILNGALLDDPEKIFNNGLDSQKSRSIDTRENESIDREGIRRLLRESIQLAQS